MMEISPREFRARTGIDLGTSVNPDHVDKIVAPRDLVKIEMMLRMRKEYLRKLLDSITLERKEEFPYRGLEFTVETVGGSGPMRSQTFVEEPKILSLVKGLGGISSAFCGESGFATLAPYILLGRNTDGHYCLAHYIPPIVEEHNSVGRVLLDGTHRASLVSAVGNGMAALIIKGVTVPFPADPVTAEEVRWVAEKPTRRTERFRNLNPNFFRDLKWIGVDG